MDAVAALPPEGGLIGAACGALGLSRASFHRRSAAAKRPPTTMRARPRPARALAVAERRAVLDLLRQPRFVDQAPAEVPHCRGMLRHDDRLALVVDLRRLTDVFPVPVI